MEEEHQDREQPEAVRRSHPQSQCSADETDSLEAAAAATVSLHDPSAEGRDCSTGGPDCSAKGPDCSPKGLDCPKGPDCSTEGPDCSPKGPDCSPEGPDCSPKGPDSSPKGPDSRAEGPDCSPKGPDSRAEGPDCSPKGPDSRAEGPVPGKPEGVKVIGSTNGPAEPELQGPGGDGPSEGMGHQSEVGADRSEVGLVDQSEVSVPDQSEVSMGHQSEVSMGHQSEVSMGHQNEVSVPDQSEVSMGHQSEVSMGHQSEVSMGHQNEVSVPDQSEVGAGDRTEVGTADQSETVAGHQSEVGAGEVNGQRQPDGGEDEEDPPENASDSASTDNTLEDSSEFVVTVLGRGNLDDQGEGPGSALSEAGGLSQGGAAPGQDEDVTAEGWRSHRKHVFVLSEAGKPIYSRYGNEEALSSTMGVMMALVSFVQSGDNTIRSIYSDEHTVVFMQQGPLVLVSVSCTRQSEQQLRDELLYVYNQIVSMLTQASINRIFERKKNYDLRRLLAGSEKILDGLLRLVDSDPSFLLSAIHCLPLASSLRDSLSQILQKAITPNLVFSILIAKSQLLTIVQEKTVIEDARLEPADLHLLLNLIGASSAFQAGEIWTPICLPLFNPDCYFYAYVSYLDPPECTVCLLLLSTDKEAFYAVAECKRRIEEGMRAHGALRAIARAQPYCASQVGVPDLRHFMYKPFDVPDNHRQLTQFTSPEMEAPYCSEEERSRLLDLYRYMHSRIHSSSRPLKLIYHVAERETLLAWVTSKFELYTCFSPLVTKASAINAITKLLRWIKKEEDRLFIRCPPKYSTTPNPSKGSRGGKGGSDRPDAADNGFLSLL
ncbi:vacuolar fusion protein MON1 homolog B isoform X1 [Anguilla anguilla]|uniref:vacuolar fusion protein MON1 homolog B isoform X1 n=1 Tax=Anguilla anguilla TaxID=7936 RepID=UPI0015AE234E|nr:vacuolar fusion protein MON1 homolog B isoform X1 [Anguilla anguilla]XP_035237949.1 vacuolar fusion protein MON1 homolog B isoform X1 [Anguilla anguilla]